MCNVQPHRQPAEAGRGQRQHLCDSIAGSLPPDTAQIVHDFIWRHFKQEAKRRGGPNREGTDMSDSGSGGKGVHDVKRRSDLLPILSDR